MGQVSLPGYFKTHGYITMGGGKTYHPNLPPNNDGNLSWSLGDRLVRKVPYYTASHTNPHTTLQLNKNREVLRQRKGEPDGRCVQGVRQRRRQRLHLRLLHRPLRRLPGPPRAVGSFLQAAPCPQH